MRRPPVLLRAPMCNQRARKCEGGRPPRPSQSPKPKAHGCPLPTYHLAYLSLAQWLRRMQSWRYFSRHAISKTGALTKSLQKDFL